MNNGTRGPKGLKPAIMSVEMPSRKLAVRIAKDQHSTIKERQEFSDALVHDAKVRAKSSFKKLMPVR